MLDLLIHISFAIFYISLGYEIIYVNIPSVVSTKKIFSLNNGDTEYFSEKTEQIFKWSKTKKIIVFVLPLIVTYILYLLPLLYHLDMLEPLYTNSSMAYLGVVLVIVGRIINILFIHQAKRKRINNVLITEGIFKFSRNPCQTGLYISLIGLNLIYPSLIYIVCFITYAISIHFRIIMEEEYLEKKFKKDYILYKSKTRRYL
ncbi:isoprenylcysteine carboxylmethyltransferase family protein [uncultured Winogradskyella sp.]|uniref:methyltransferase family protein n=1 Tax=uncultured Winogradskyella sp. TaxID=395353 RepID=UPI00261239B6|nr:isoprenylcysteine carboxylmethyltransferase family protein [uncultured Winogradskyella sp.]